MSPTRPKKGPANIPVKTAIHVSYAVMIAAAYALAKNPATVKNSSWPAVVCLHLTGPSRSYIVYLR